MSASCVATTSAKPSSRWSASIRSSTRLAGVRVEVPGRLVAQQQLGLLRERAGDRDALRLAAGQLRRQVVGLRVEPHEGRAARSGSASPPETVRGERDVLEGREVGEQVRALEDVGDPVYAHSAASSGVECRRAPCPSTRPCPRSARPDHRATCSSVVLPEPERPSSATRSPALTLSVIPSSARTAASPSP